METIIKSNIKQIMKDKGLKYTDLQDFGLSPVTISNAIKSIDKCKMETLKRFASIFDCKVSDLYEELPFKSTQNKKTDLETF